MRCEHEHIMHHPSSVVTLTYADAPDSLVKADFDKFWISVRRYCKRVHGFSPKMIVGGEYGEQFGRPHFHACVFGIGAIEMNQVCARFWKHGFFKVDRFSRRAAEYCVEYLFKSDLPPDDPRSPQFVSFSRGLGLDWLRSHWKDVVRDGYILHDGHKMAIPPSYLQWINRKMNNSSSYVKLVDSCDEYKSFRSRLDLSSFDEIVSQGKHVALPDVPDRLLDYYRVHFALDGKEYPVDDLRIFVGMEILKHDFSESEVTDKISKRDYYNRLYDQGDFN